MSDMDDVSQDQSAEESRTDDLPGFPLTSQQRQQRSRNPREPNGNWLHDHLLSVALAILFVVCLTGQLLLRYQAEVHDALQHGGSAPDFFSNEFWVVFLSSVLEDWQSEFLQLLTLVVLTVYLIHRGSPQSRDSTDEMADDIKAIRAKLGA